MSVDDQLTKFHFFDLYLGAGLLDSNYLFPPIGLGEKEMVSSQYLL